MTTNPHPTPEERYEAALSSAVQKSLASKDDIMPSIKAAMIAAIREAEAAGEARGRAMERKEITARARRLRKRFGKCEGSFREEVVWEHGLRIEKMIRARTDKENSDD